MEPYHEHQHTQERACEVGYWRAAVDPEDAEKGDVARGDIARCDAAVAQQRGRAGAAAATSRSSVVAS